MPVTTQDTRETITSGQVLGDYHHDTGYDWMEDIEAAGWVVIPSWGIDGWDLGMWPYVMVAATRTADHHGELFGMAIYCEGDVTTTWYRTQKAHWVAISAHAHFHWRSGQASGPGDLPETAADMPAECAQPFPGWAH